ncbi:hypothetical protein M514_13367 [Trichuris suis]|uniref:Uncharacterized protein n=1 Tax=Trichuris suis TaxID=68888 RepID=A0A085LLB5_9BILA|nr:hypothetical protein M513_13367 [Trichuris suis]KFD67159.1 hypothetical protein M514_13367 [Trichuris suis]
MSGGGTKRSATFYLTASSFLARLMSSLPIVVTTDAHHEPLWSRKTRGAEEIPHRVKVSVTPSELAGRRHPRPTAPNFCSRSCSYKQHVDIDGAFIDAFTELVPSHTRMAEKK